MIPLTHHNPSFSFSVSEIAQTLSYRAALKAVSNIKLGAQQDQKQLQNIGSMSCPAQNLNTPKTQGRDKQRQASLR
ncbi:MAG: hypothetical protein COB04_07985 [Gammaproteobacteria bacterium]|nr:MAG: hypothetical protein COB04_07985 [Gammaproteobacteria bacterium]